MPKDQSHLSFAAAAQADRLDALSREYRPALSRYFGKRAYQQADVEDLVQEVLVRLAVRGDGSDIEQPEAYLMRTATNVWRDFLRKQRTHAQDAHEEFLEERHPNAESGPDHVLEGMESVEAVLAALNELPARTRQIFILYRVEGLRQKRVAKRIGISVSAVEKHMIKAIAHLAVHLDQR
jgi:RNA polymerase sigma factor (sigma-70 family)